MSHTFQPQITQGDCRTQVAPAPPARSAAGVHGVLLGLSLAVILLSMSLTLGREPGDVLLPFMDRPLPTLCHLKRFTGLDCPGCGLTRSFIALGHGRWRDSLRFNPAGPLWFALIAAQIPWQLLQLKRISRNQASLDAAWWGQGAIYTALAALIVQWVVRQFGGL